LLNINFTKDTPVVLTAAAITCGRLVLEIRLAVGDRGGHHQGSSPWKSPGTSPESKTPGADHRGWEII